MYITVQFRMRYLNIFVFFQYIYTYIYQYIGNPKLNNFSELGSYLNIFHTFAIHNNTLKNITNRNHTFQSSFPLSFITTLILKSYQIFIKYIYFL